MRKRRAWSFWVCYGFNVFNFFYIIEVNYLSDDLDSSTCAKALGVMGFEGATKGTFKHGMKKQVRPCTIV